MKTLTLSSIQTDIRSLSDPKRAQNFTWFFKTAPGQYGHGDKFLGLNTPQMRTLSRKYKSLPLSLVGKLITSPYHEERSIAIQILVHQYSQNPQVVYDFYLHHTQYINNWDLVDISAPKIVGNYLLDKDIAVLKTLACSSSLWEKRIAIVSTFAFIYRGQSTPTLEISKLLLNDKHDLIHKAVGWMLREVGKRCDQSIEESFIQTHYSQIPRTTLRYAIERFPESLRQQYLAGKFS